MNNTLSKVLIFTAGVAIGSVVTWKLVENKYKKIAQEEIDSVKEVFSRKKKEESAVEEPNDDIYGEDEPVKKEKTARQLEKEEYEDLIERSSYISYSDKKEEINMEKPYIISPEEYEEGDYDRETLDYYEGDGVLVDAFGEIVDDVAETVGEDFSSRFGEYEQDTVYVRNDITEIDYEILRVFGNYSES